MKRLSVVVMCLMVAVMTGSGAANGQSVMAGDEMFIEMLKHDIREARTEVVTSVMQLSADDAAIFWPIYNEYRKKASVLIDDELAQVNEYAGAYWSLTNTQATEMANKFFEIEKKRLALLEGLYRDLAKGLNPVQAMKATQVEYRMDLILDMQMANELPMVE